MGSSTLSSVDLLCRLFEPSPAMSVIAASLPNKEQPTQVIEALRLHLLDLVDQTGPNSRAPPDEISAAERTLLEIINAHPRLGNRPVPSEEETLSDLSRQEQDRMKVASAAQGGTTEQIEAENSELARLQDLYESQYGMRFLVFVNGRPRSEILTDLKQRLMGKDVHVEKRTAVNASCDIALQRASNLV